jgi:uncharacterized membrane protein HdeD (DUF308 family)
MTPSRQMRALEAGTASFVDVVGTAMRRSLAGKLGRTITTDDGNATARGVLGVAIGVALIAWPEESLATMVVGFGAYAVADGLLSLLGARGHGWQRAVEGIVGIATGACALLRPDLGRAALLSVLAVWVVVMGTLRLRAALRFDDRISVRWVPALLALLAIVAGSTALITPDRGLIGVMINIAVFPVLNGVALIAHPSERTAAGPRP